MFRSVCIYTSIHMLMIQKHNGKINSNFKALPYRGRVITWMARDGN